MRPMPRRRSSASGWNKRPRSACRSPSMSVSAKTGTRRSPNDDRLSFEFLRPFVREGREVDEERVAPDPVTGHAGVVPGGAIEVGEIETCREIQQSKPGDSRVHFPFFRELEAKIEADRLQHGAALRFKVFRAQPVDAGAESVIHADETLFRYREHHRGLEGGEVDLLAVRKVRRLAAAELVLVFLRARESSAEIEHEPLFSLGP